MKKERKTKSFSSYKKWESFIRKTYGNDVKFDTRDLSQSSNMRITYIGAIGKDDEFYGSWIQTKNIEKGISSGSGTVVLPDK